MLGIGAIHSIWIAHINYHAMRESLWPKSIAILGFLLAASGLLSTFLLYARMSEMDSLIGIPLNLSYLFWYVGITAYLLYLDIKERAKPSLPTEEPTSNA